MKFPIILSLCQLYSWEREKKHGCTDNCVYVCEWYIHTLHTSCTHFRSSNTLTSQIRVYLNKYTVTMTVTVTCITIDIYVYIFLLDAFRGHSSEGTWNVQFLYLQCIMWMTKKCDHARVKQWCECSWIHICTYTYSGCIHTWYFHFTYIYKCNHCDI